MFEQSLDYENYENELTVREEKLNGYKTVVASNVVRWLIYFSIAICTAGMGICIDTAIEYLCTWKYQSIRNYIDVNHSTAQCLMIWLLFTVLPTVVGSCVVLFMEVIIVLNKITYDYYYYLRIICMYISIFKNIIYDSPPV